MSPLVRAALAAVLLSAVARVAETRSTRAGPTAPSVIPGAPGETLESLCPAGTLPDANVCIPVPSEPESAEGMTEQSNAHRERSGQWRIYDQIPRRPDRPADYRRYRYPVAALPGPRFIMSGYDLHLPDAAQRRGAQLSAVGHGGIDLAQQRGADVRLITLEHQVGQAEVLHVGPLMGHSVVTRHTVREAGKLREYLLIHGHLDGAAPGLKRGMQLADGALLGFVGDSGSPGIVHLHLEVRRVRSEVNAGQLGPGELTVNAKTVACDPRNVLPLSS